MSSLSNMIKSLRHKGQITDEQCDELLNKLKGHDEEMLGNAVNLIRCRECKYWWKVNKLCTHEKCVFEMCAVVKTDGNHYCGFAEKKGKR